MVHVTVPPTAIARGFGLYAVDCRIEAPMTIEAGVPGDVGAGVGVGLVGVGVNEDPQLSDKPISSVTRANEQRWVLVLTNAGPQAFD